MLRRARSGLLHGHDLALGTAADAGAGDEVGTAGEVVTGAGVGVVLVFPPPIEPTRLPPKLGREPTPPPTRPGGVPGKDCAAGSPVLDVSAADVSTGAAAAFLPRLRINAAATTAPVPSHTQRGTGPSLSVSQLASISSHAPPTPQTRTGSHSRRRPAPTPHQAPRRSPHTRPVRTRSRPAS